MAKVETGIGRGNGVGIIGIEITIERGKETGIEKEIGRNVIELGIGVRTVKGIIVQVEIKIITLARIEITGPAVDTSKNVRNIEDRNYLHVYVAIPQSF